MFGNVKPKSQETSKGLKGRRGNEIRGEISNQRNQQLYKAKAIIARKVGGRRHRQARRGAEADARRARWRRRQEEEQQRRRRRQMQQKKRQPTMLRVNVCAIHFLLGLFRFGVEQAHLLTLIFLEAWARAAVTS